MPLPTNTLSLIQNRESFKISNVTQSEMGGLVDQLERMIENEGLRCRIYTKGRIAAAGVGLFSLGAGAAALAGIAAHNIATFNPDYEIEKDLLGSSLTVSYKK